MRSPLFFPSSATASAAIGRLRRSNGFEAVVKTRSKEKVVTLLDFLKVVDPSRTSLESIATSAIPISPDASLLEAIDLVLMSQAWSLIVKQSEKVLGVVSQLDMLKVVSSAPYLRDIPCGEVVDVDAPRVNTDDRLSTARTSMRKYGITYLPVVEGENFVGAISIRDLVFNLLQPKKSSTWGSRGGESAGPWRMPVKSVMDRSPFTAERTTPLSKVLETLGNGVKDGCVVVEGSKVLGVIGPREVLSVLLRFMPKEEPRIYIIGLPEFGDFATLKTAKDKLARTVSRIFDLRQTVVEVMIDVEQKKRQGKRTLYEVRARVYSPSRLINVSAQGWYLSKAIDDICKRLDRRRSRVKRRPDREPRLYMKGS